MPDPVLILALMLAAAGVGAGLGAVAVRRGRDRANQVVPGVATRAPASWAGAHSPEARLHRRLRDLVAAVHAIPGLDDVVAGTRHQLERHALALDERLVAVAALPADARAEPLARLAAAVGGVEASVASLTAEVAAAPPAGDLVGPVTERLARLADARAELDALASPPVAPPRATGAGDPPPEPP